MEWAINSRLSLSALVPARISLKYKLSPIQSLGVTGGYMGGMYRLTPTGQNRQDQYLNLQQYSGGLIYDLKLGQRWKLNFIAGHTFQQRLETFNMDQKVSFDNFGKLNDRKANVSYRQNSFVFQAGISYAFLVLTRPRIIGPFYRRKFPFQIILDRMLVMDLIY